MRWQLALDAADHALAAAHGPVHVTNADGRRRELVQERLATAKLLTRLGRLTGVQPLPWLSPVPVTTKMLGLPDGATACLFDLDGVLTDSGVLHAWAWAEVFDDLPVAPERDNGLALHPVRPRPRLPELHRRPRPARGRSRLPRQPRHPSARGALRRSGRRRHRLRARSAQGRCDGPRPAPARRHGRRRRPPLSRGERPRGAEARRRLGQLEHTSDAWSSPGSRASSRSASTPM